MPIELKSSALEVVSKLVFFFYIISGSSSLPVSYCIYKGIKAETTINLISPQCFSATKDRTRQGGKLQIPSMFAKHFSKKDIRELIPGLSKWHIDQAHRHAAEAGPGQPVVSAPIKRTRLDPVKTNHFFNFIASENFIIQDVAYGTKKTKARFWG